MFPRLIYTLFHFIVALSDFDTKIMLTHDVNRNSVLFLLSEEFV